jgi:DNA-binding transcriptional LysR family regulator
MSGEPLHWDDFRLLLAADRAGSLSGAAGELAVDPTTASRRMKALERSLGLSLFVRTHGALRLTEEGRRLLEHARSMEREERALRVTVGMLKEAPQGAVRVSAPPTLARCVICPSVGALRAAAPNLCLEVDTEPANVRLENWDADIAVRLGAPKGVTDTLLVRRFGSADYAVFEPEAPGGDLGWIAYPARFRHVPEAAHVETALAGRAPVLRSNDPMAMALAVANGAGRAVLPVALAGSVPGIVQAGPPVLSREIWGIRHRESGRTSGVRTVHEWLAGLFDAAR